MAKGPLQLRILCCADEADRDLAQALEEALRALDPAQRVVMRHSAAVRRRRRRSTGGASAEPPSPAPDEISELGELLEQSDLILLCMTARYGASDEWTRIVAPALAESHLAHKAILLRARPFLLLEEDLAPLRLRHPAAEDQFLVGGDSATAGSAALHSAAHAVFTEAQAILRERLGSSSAASLSGSALRAALLEPEALWCGRGRQFSHATEPRPRHEILIVPGDLHQGHLYFLHLLEQEWEHPARCIRAVPWPIGAEPEPDVPPGQRLPPFPLRRQGFLEGLAAALGTGSSEDELRQRFAELLEEQDLVLLHDCVSSDHRGAPLLQYYTEWLPALLPKSPRTRAEHVVKCVQPVAWDRSSWLGRSLGRLLGLLLTQRPGPRWLERCLVRDDAEGFIRSLSLPASTQASDALAVWRVLELVDIEEPELREFCAGHKLLPALIPEVLRGETSEKRLCLVSDNLHRFRLRS